jgi:beta-lactamase class A
MQKRVSLIIGIVLGAVVTLCAVQFIHSREVSSECDAYTYINNFACTKQVISKAEYSRLKIQLTEYIEHKKTDGSLIETGIFFRDLKAGPTMGINEYEEFSTASLLKMPTLVTYLRLAEKDPEILQQQLVVDEGIQTDVNQFNQTYPPKEQLEQNHPYTVDELLFRLGAYSDNIATEVLNMYLTTRSTDTDLLMETYKELGLVPDISGEDFVLSVKRYSSIFRSLFNGSYLSPKMSQKAFEYLSASDFKSGLVAGVPQDVVVVHKFGERTTLASDSESVEIKQLHDCGIVYFPENPYLLCVMTRGTEYKALEGVIRDISRMVYEEVDSRRLP